MVERGGSWGGRAACALVVLALLGACGRTEAPAPTPSHPRVLLVGLDGASPRVVEPLIAQGRLPTLAGIAEQGASGTLRSFLPLYSPRVWTTVATGKDPAKHGIKAFVRIDEAGGRHIYLSSDRTTHALWNIVSDAGMRVGVVNWWTTQPPERINGVMVTDHLFPEVREERQAFLRATLDAADTAPVHPADWLARVEDLTNEDERLTDVENPFTRADAFPAWVDTDFLSYRFRFDETIARIALAIEDELHPELLMVLLPGVDKVSHMIWGALEPDDELPPGTRFTAEQKAYAAEALYRVYEQADGLVGRLAQNLAADDLVIVLSDHGFHVGGAMGRLTGLHKDKRARDAVLFARGRGIPAGAGTDGTTVRDVTPTVLAWLGLPLGRDMDGHPAAFLDLPPPATIATHDTTPIERVGEATPDVQESLVEELRVLGYLDEPQEAGPESAPKPSPRPAETP
jgi:predicted AlkP superfamily pyrophosphatase or phosphodiesterase